MRHYVLLLAGLTVGIGCGGSGIGSGVRDDISHQMLQASPKFQSCYQEALVRNPESKGVVRLSFETAPKSGAFRKVNVAKSEIDDAELQSCITGEVEKLKLRKPPKAIVAVPDYPIKFTPAQ